MEIDTQKIVFEVENSLEPEYPKNTEFAQNRRKLREELFRSKPENMKTKRHHFLYEVSQISEGAEYFKETPKPVTAVREHL